VKHSGEVLHDAIGLVGDPTVDEFPCGGVDRYLARGEDPLPRDHCLGVRAESLGGLRRMNELQVIHAIMILNFNVV
jgi:hypothetical protein